MCANCNDSFEQQNFRCNCNRCCDRVCIMRGPAGPRGPMGPIGPRGFNGERGERGFQGERGERGERGFPGQQGLRGERGERGERGLNGERGERGFPGQQGARGERGERGEIGERGPQGIQGPFGPQGLTGEKGEKGDPGEGIEPVFGGTFLTENMSKHVQADTFHVANGNRIMASERVRYVCDNSIEILENGIYEIVYHVSAESECGDFLDFFVQVNDCEILGTRACATMHPHNVVPFAGSKLQQLCKGDIVKLAYKSSKTTTITLEKDTLSIFVNKISK